MADSKVTALTELTDPQSTDLLYIVDDPGGTPLSKKIPVGTLGSAVAPASVCEGRLTLESGVAVSTTDQLAKGTLYFTPYNGNRIGLYDATKWESSTFTELSRALAITSGKNYDVFVWSDSGTKRLVLGTAWTNDTTRALAISLQDGIYVNDAQFTSVDATGYTVPAKTGRYVGTIRASAANQTADSEGGTTTQVGGTRFVWNYYHRVRRALRVIDDTNSWSNAGAGAGNSSVFRQANNNAGNKVEYVCGMAATWVEAQVLGLCNNDSSSAALSVAIGVDSVSTPSGCRAWGGYDGSSNSHGGTTGGYAGAPGLGYHYLAWLENNRGNSSTSCTWYGDYGNLTYYTTIAQCGLVAMLEC